MNNIINMSSQIKWIITLDDTSKANELNKFLLSFETQDLESTTEPLETDPRQVQYTFSKVCNKKSRVWKRASEFAWCRIFQKPPDTYTIPDL